MTEIWIGSALCALAVAVFVYAALRFVSSLNESIEEYEASLSSFTERDRNISMIHVAGQRAEPLVASLPALGSVGETLDARLKGAGRPLGDLKGETLAGACLFAGFLLAPVIFVGALFLLPAPDLMKNLPVAVLLGMLSIAAPLFYAMISLRSMAQVYSRSLQRDFPYYLDLALLVTQAGGNQPEAADIYIANNPDTPLAAELRVMRTEMSVFNFQDALARLEDRIDDERIRIILRNIGQADLVGGEMETFLANQAEELRFIRSEMAEAAAERLKSNMKLPEFLMMMAITGLLISPAIVLLQNPGAY